MKTENIDLRETLLEYSILWRGKSLIGIEGHTSEELRAVLNIAACIKKIHRSRSVGATFSYPATLALLFEKPSLRTRTSFEAGIAQLGGTAIYLAPNDVGLGTRESVEDVAGSLSRWVDCIAARVFDHKTVVDLNANSTVPVINALSDREHPLQMFADMLTIQEQYGQVNGLKMTYIGDGNNVLNSLMLTCALMGINLTAACPEGYTPDPYFVSESQEIAAKHGDGTLIEVISDPVAAVCGADIVYTDVWTSMGQEAESVKRRTLFSPFTVTTKLMANAKPGAVAMHCLPAHRGEEISGDVMAQHKNVILDQAENRLHTQKALLLLILGLV